MQTESSEITVFHDGGCPVCRMEVRWYSHADKHGRIDWQDIERLEDASLPEGKTRDELLNRFHVHDREGRWHVGVDAFARIWRELPGFRHFAFLFSVPGLRQAAGAGYRGFLAWQRRDRARRKRSENRREQTAA